MPMLAVASVLMPSLYARSYYDEYDAFGRKRIPDAYQDRYRQTPRRREPPPPPPPQYDYYNGQCYYDPPGSTVVQETDFNEYTKYKVRNDGTLKKKNKVKVYRKKNGRTTKIYQKMPKRIRVRPRKER